MAAAAVQVRHMVGALLAVGEGRLDPLTIQQLLQDGQFSDVKGA